MYMFGIVSLFAAFSAVAHAAAIPLTPTPTQSACANEQSAIMRVHGLTEQIRSKLVEMQEMPEGQMPGNNLVVPMNDARNLADTILEITKADNGGAVVSIAATRVVREVTVDHSGLGRFFKKAADAPSPVQTCSNEKAVLSHVQDLAGQLQEKLVLMQNHGGLPVLPSVLGEALKVVLLLVSEVLELVLGGIVGGTAGGPLSGVGVVGGVAGGVAKGAAGTVAGGVINGVVGTGAGAALGIVGGALGVNSGGSASPVDC